MRAYIVSLIAVFLALAIGILLGTVVVDKGVLVEQQKSLVQKIQSQITELRQRNTELRDAVKRSDEFAERVFPEATANRLVGKNVLLVVLPNTSAKTKKELADTVTFAGASVSVATITSHTFELQEQRVLDQMAAYFQGEDVAEKDYVQKVAQELATDLTGEKEFAFAGLLNSLNLIVIEGPWPIKPDSVVVIEGDARGSNGFFTGFILPFVERLKEVNLSVVATELENAESSHISRYRQAGAVATVDNVDTIYGKTALVYALNGAQGNFGTKRTADRLLPPL